MVDIEHLLMLFRLLLGTVFLSSGFSKLTQFDVSILVIKEYKVIPRTIVKPFLIINITLEIALGIFLYIGLYLKTASILGILLIVIYIGAISINLVKGRTNISCGCGGILESKGISWFLVLRNLIFLLLFCILYNYSTIYLFINIERSITQFPSDVFSVQFLLIMFTTCLIFNIYKIYNELYGIRNHFRGFT